MTTLKKIYHADDDEEDADFVRQALLEIDETIEYLHFDDCINLLDNPKEKDSAAPDIILLDTQMPKRDGLSCLTELKTNPYFEHVYIAMTSTSVSDDMLGKLYDAGASCYMKKRDSHSALKAALERLLALADERPERTRENFVI